MRDSFLNRDYTFFSDSIRRDTSCVSEKLRKCLVECFAGLSGSYCFDNDRVKPPETTMRRDDLKTAR